MKAVNLSITVLVLVVLLTITAISIIGPTIDVFGKLSPGTTADSVKNSACLVLQSTGCVNPSSVKVDFDADMNGVVDNNDDLQDLCDNYYNTGGSVTECRRQCRCIPGSQGGGGNGNGGEPTQECSDGTLYGECSSNKPKYCDDNGNLLDNYCYGPDLIVGTTDDCGCSSGECQTDGSCEIVSFDSCDQACWNNEFDSGECVSGEIPSEEVFNAVWCWESDIDEYMLNDLVSHNIFNVFVHVGYPNWYDDSRLSTINPVTGIPIVPEYEIGISNWVTLENVASLNQLLASVDSRLKLWAWFGTWSNDPRTDPDNYDHSGHFYAKVDLSTENYRSWLIENIVRVADYGFYGVQDDTEDVYQTSTFAQMMQDQVDFWNEEQIALNEIGVKLATFTYAGPPSLWTYNPPFEFVKQLNVDYIIACPDYSQTQEVIDYYGPIEEIWESEITAALSDANSPVIINTHMPSHPDWLYPKLLEIDTYSYPNFVGHASYHYRIISDDDWNAWDNYMVSLPSSVDDGTTQTTCPPENIVEADCPSGQVCCCSQEL